MEKKIIRTNNAPAPIGPYNQAVQFGNILFVSGQIAIDAQSGELITGDVKTETTIVMQNLNGILKEAGMDFSNVLKATIFLTDMKYFAQVNEIYGSYFTENPPARESLVLGGSSSGLR